MNESEAKELLEVHLRFLQERLVEATESLVLARHQLSSYPCECSSSALCLRCITLSKTNFGLSFKASSKLCV